MTIKGRQLFVGNLPFVVGWQDLKDLFRSAGNVQRANIMQSRDGRSKGHGIVLFATVVDAQKAISTFDGYEWHGRRLEVREDRSAMDYPPPPPRTESAANSMSQNETENETINTTNGIITTTTITEFNGSASASNTQVSSPVEYSSENISLVNGTSNGTYTVDESTTSTVATTTGSGSTAVNGAGGNIQRQLFVGNLPFRVRWQDLKDLFRKAGTVLRADVAMGYDNRSKGHGTVLFASLDDAKNAIQIFHNYSWQGRVLEVREDRGFVDPNTNNGNSISLDQIRRVPETVLNQHSQSPFVPNTMIAPGIFYGPRGIQAPAPNYAGRLLFVGNLPFNCQWQDLKDLFRNAGNIVRADVSTNYDGRSRGFGTVLFATPEDARKAVVMYNGFEYQGRTLRVHFDKFTLPTIPPHPHAGPHPHLVPPLHQRPPPLMPNIAHHNFHIGPPMHHHPHFMHGPHIGPFSPPLTTPQLTSPPPFPATYNPLAHLGAAAPSTTNGTNLFQSMQIINSAGSVHGSNTQSTTNQAQGLISHDQSIATPPLPQFPLGPIGKGNTSLPIGASSTNSGLGAIGAFPPVSGVINGTAGANIGGNGIDSSLGNGANDSIQNLTAAVAGLHLNPNPQQLFFHPAHHHPHHRPTVIPAAYHHPSLAAAAAAAVAHHLQQQQQHPHHQQPPNHTQHPHHNHPGAIGSGIVGGMSNNHYTNYHQQIHQHPHVNETSNLASSATTASTSSPSLGVIDADANGTNSVIIGSASTSIDVASSQTNNATGGNSATSSTGSAIMVSSNAIWDNGTTGILNSNSNSANCPNGTNQTSTSVMGIGMAATLAAALDASTGPGIPAAAPQSVFVRNM